MQGGKKEKKKCILKLFAYNVSSGIIIHILMGEQASYLQIVVNVTKGKEQRGGSVPMTERMVPDRVGASCAEL